MKKNFAITSLVLFFVAMIYFIFSGYSSVGFLDLEIYEQVILVVGLLSAFIFWMMMLADFFNSQSVKNKVIWGFCLIFFSWIASGVYFFKYFLPKYKGSRVK